MCEAHHTVTTYNVCIPGTRVQSTARSTMYGVSQQTHVTCHVDLLYQVVQQFNVRGVTGAPYSNDVPGTPARNKTLSTACCNLQVTTRLISHCHVDLL